MSILNLTIFTATNDFEIGLYLQVCNYRFFDANIFQPFGQAELIFIQISGYVKLSVSLWEFMAGRYVKSPNEESSNEESPTSKYPKIQKVLMQKVRLLNKKSDF